jgi:DNA helicase-2/ATP-dependent DNA helicase PcrA
MSGRAAVKATPAYRRAVQELSENEPQRAAYDSTGHCVVLAGPGSGKTKTLTVKMAKLLIEEIHPPRNVACLTYSTECARELRRRLDRLGVHSSDNAYVGTVHSFCLHQVVLPFARLAGIALPNPLRIAISSDQDRLFADAVAVEMGVDEPPSNWRTRVDAYRRTHLDRDGPDWQEDPHVASLAERYEGLLRGEGMIDFEDMVLIGLRLIESHEWVRRALRAKFPVLVVDEYQDLGVPLHRIVQSLCFRAGVRLFAVGDPDQSIYGFTGARPDLLRELSRVRGVATVQLQFNYRSGRTIIAASETALGEPRGYQSRAPAAGTVDFYERPDGIEDQARYICEELVHGVLERIDGATLGDVAVLYLDKTDGDVIATAAAAQGLEYMRVDRGGPYQRTPASRWLEDCARWCAGGWRTAEPRLSDLVTRFRGFTRLASRRIDFKIARRRLVAFLLSHRTPEAALRDWLLAFKEECLDLVFEDEPTLRDERQAIAGVLSASEDGRPLVDWTVATFAGQGGSPNHLNLITLHSAKGLEFRAVIMFGMEQGRLPRYDAAEAGKREARRLFYVGLTRAREEVHLIFSGWTRNRYGRRFNNGPSEFLLEVRERLAG